MSPEIFQRIVDHAREYVTEWRDDEWNDPVGFARALVAAADRIDELEELLRLVHVDVVRASGVLVDLDDRIAAALKDKP
jgi:hypothetical protein